MDRFVESPMFPFTVYTGIALILIGLGVRFAWPYLRKLSHLVDDMTGEQARPGVPARPGVVESIADVKSDVAGLQVDVNGIGRKLEVVRHEVEFNNGSSVKDATVRLESGVADLTDAQKRQAVELAEIKAMLAVGSAPNVTVTTVNPEVQKKK